MPTAYPRWLIDGLDCRLCNVKLRLRLRRGDPRAAVELGRS